MSLEYVAIARLAPDFALMLAFYSDLRAGRSSDANAVVVDRVVRAPGLLSQQQHLLTSGSRYIWVEHRRGLAFIAITSRDYPKRLVWSRTSSSSRPTLMGELVSAVESDEADEIAAHGAKLALNAHAAHRIEALFEHFADPQRADQLMRVSRALETTKSHVVKSLSAATENTALMESVVMSSSDFEDGTHTFLSGARRAERNAWWAVRGRCIVLLLAVLLAGVIALVCVNYFSTHWWGQEEGGNDGGSGKHKNATMPL